MTIKTNLELQEHIISYTEKLIEEINYGLVGNSEERANQLVRTLEEARKHFISLDSTYYPNTKNKEIDGRLTILAQFLSGAKTERKRIVAELEYQNLLMKRQ